MIPIVGKRSCHTNHMLHWHLVKLPDCIIAVYLPSQKRTAGLHHLPVGKAFKRNLPIWRCELLVFGRIVRNNPIPNHLISHFVSMIGSKSQPCPHPTEKKTPRKAWQIHRAKRFVPQWICFSGRELGASFQLVSGS